ncbi:hypothetical protein MMC13_007961 [Lambiella insularis]|nr:hypothetical protein [Lambiella insularis]
MSEDKQLLSRIAELAGHINLCKVRTSAGHDRIQLPHQKLPPPAQVSFELRNSLPAAHLRVSSQGRGAIRKITPRVHHNRTLVLKNTAPVASPVVKNAACPDDPAGTKAEVAGSTGHSQAQAIATWVSKRDRHLQLISSSIFDKETILRAKAIDKTRHEKIVRRNQREKLKIRKHLLQIFDTVSLTGPRLMDNNTAARKVAIDGLSFRVQMGGSKLVRDQDTKFAGLTPKRAVVGGVTFLRSQNGNLYRAGLGFGYDEEEC